MFLTNINVTPVTDIFCFTHVQQKTRSLSIWNVLLLHPLVVVILDTILITIACVQNKDWTKERECIGAKERPKRKTYEVYRCIHIYKMTFSLVFFQGQLSQIQENKREVRPINP